MTSKNQQKTALNDTCRVKIIINLNITLSNFLATFEAEMIILPQAAEIEMKNGVASERKNMYLKINIFILTVFIKQTSTLPFRSVLPLYRNQSTDLQSKSRGRFLYNGKTSFFNVEHHLFHIYFLLPCGKSSLFFLIVQPNHLFYTKA